MNTELLELAEQPWNKFKKIGKFESRFNIFPPEEASQLVDEFNFVTEKIPVTDNPTTLEEVMCNDLKRKYSAQIGRLSRLLSGRPETFDDVINANAIDRSDLEDLKPWLLNNRKAAIDAIERVYKLTNISDYELDVSGDIPGIRRQAEEIALSNVENYHQKLGKMVEKISPIGGFLREIKAVATTNERSYFSTTTKILALGIPKICYMSPDRTIHPNHRKLIALYGHEGLGHALHSVVTMASNLPFFLKDTNSTKATLESVAQFYETVIFDDLLNHPDVQESLTIAHNYKEIYQEEQDTRLITDYQNNLFRYSITVLGDKSLGDPEDPDVMKKKIDLLSEVTLMPYYPYSTIYGNRHNFDPQGNLNPSMVGELIYAAKPVERVIKNLNNRGIHFDGSGRSIIDNIILTGFWTPQGLVERASLVSK